MPEAFITQQDLDLLTELGRLNVYAQKLSAAADTVLALARQHERYADVVEAMRGFTVPLANLQMVSLLRIIVKDAITSERESALSFSEALYYFATGKPHASHDMVGMHASPYCASCRLGINDKTITQPCEGYAIPEADR